MNLDQLKVFLTVSELGSFQKAAQANYVSQRAISQQMKRLEDELGVKLFIRGKNRVQLTSAGNFFKERSQAILRMVSDTSQNIMRFDQLERHNLKVGYFSPFDALLLKRLIFDLANEIDFIVVEEGIEHVITDVLMNDLDCAIVMDDYGFNQNFSAMGLGTQALHTDRMVIGVSEQLPFSDTITIDQLKNQPIIYYSNEESTYLKKAFTASLGTKLPSLSIQRVDSFEQMQMKVALGQALSFYPRQLISVYDQPDSHIRYLPLKDAMHQEFSFNLLYRNDNLNPALKQLIRHAQQSKKPTDEQLIKPV